jgi:uncharacterized membrane protein
MIFWIWTLFALLAFTVHSFRPEYILPNNMITVALQVLGIFFGSKASKYVCERRSAADNIDPGREKLIIDMISAKGQVTRQAVVDELKVSSTTAYRILQGMEGKNLIQRKGEGRGIYYILP